MPETWSYEHRYEMQEITKNLFLGPYNAAQNLKTLLKNQISHIFIIKAKNEYFIKPFHPTKFQYQVYEVENSQFTSLIDLFEIITTRIKSILDQNQKLLLHCVGGISRAPAIATAYLIKFEQKSFDEAFNVVQNKRFCVNPLESFITQLKSYENILSSFTVHSDGQLDIGTNGFLSLDGQLDIGTNVLSLDGQLDIGTGTSVLSVGSNGYPSIDSLDGMNGNVYTSEANTAKVYYSEGVYTNGNGIGGNQNSLKRPFDSIS